MDSQLWRLSFLKYHHSQIKTKQVDRALRSLWDVSFSRLLSYNKSMYCKHESIDPLKRLLVHLAPNKYQNIKQSATGGGFLVSTCQPQY